MLYELPSNSLSRQGENQKEMETLVLRIFDKLGSIFSPLEKEMATHSSTLAWKTPWMDVPGRLHSKGLQRVAHD